MLGGDFKIGETCRPYYSSACFRGLNFASFCSIMFPGFLSWQNANFDYGYVSSWCWGVLVASHRYSPTYKKPAGVAPSERTLEKSSFYIWRFSEENFWGQTASKIKIGCVVHKFTLGEHNSTTTAWPAACYAWKVFPRVLFMSPHGAIP